MEQKQLTPEDIVQEFLNEKNPNKRYFVEAIQIYAAQQTAALREELEEKNKIIEKMGALSLQLFEMRMQNEEKDARIKELEDHSKSLNEKMCFWKAESDKHFDRIKELEAVKKDKQYLYGRLEETKDVLDEAVKLLHTVPDKHSFHHQDDYADAHGRWDNDKEQFLSSLSSGYTKPEIVYTCDQVRRELLPRDERLKAYRGFMLGLMLLDGPIGASVKEFLGKLDIEHPVHPILFDYPKSPYPAPPESLTDKK